MIPLVTEEGEDNDVKKSIPILAYHKTHPDWVWSQKNLHKMLGGNVGTNTKSHGPPLPGSS